VLDNYNNVPKGWDDDVFMAIGWDFTLASDETAVIELILSDIIPTDIFYLSHMDPDSNERIYFYSTLEIQSPAAPIPEPGTIMSLATGLFGFFGIRRKWFRKP